MYIISAYSYGINVGNYGVGSIEELITAINKATDNGVYDFCLGDKKDVVYFTVHRKAVKAKEGD